MALGLGPTKLIATLQDDWEASRTGRGDIPDVIRDSNGDPTSDPDESADEGVVILPNRSEVRINKARHDVIHAYHPEGNAPDTTDRGYDEQRIVETVQIDIDITDRTDHDTDPSERLGAKARMIGTRDDLASTSDPPYGGISGEVQYILESYRRGLAEWDRVNYTPVRMYLGNSNATVSWSVDLIQLAANTV